MNRQDFTVSSISFAGFVRQVLKNWWVVLCLTLAVFLGTTGLGMLTYAPLYTATATLVTRSGGTNAYSSLSQTTQMAAVYREVFQSSALRKLISDSIGEPVEGAISCEQISETNLLVLTVTSPTPRQAYLFISSALKNYEQITDYVFSNAAMEIVQEPSVPQNPSNTSPLIANRLTMTALAAIGSVLLIFLIYVLRHTLKVASQAGALLDGTVLGVIPYEQKRSVKGTKRRRDKIVQALLLNSPRVSMFFAEASRRTAAQLESHLQRQKLQALAVTSVEENEGKSTVAANIALALAERGRKVLLVDGDFRKPAQYRIFDEKDSSNYSFSDLLNGQADGNSVITQDPATGIWKLFQYKPVSDPVMLLNSPQLAQVVEQLKTQMDFIIIDCSPVSAVADAELWMQHVDSGLLVVRQDMSDTRVVNDTVDLIWKSAGDFSGFVLNGFQSETLNHHRSGYYGNY